jgi:hypothetical protein
VDLDFPAGACGVLMGPADRKRAPSEWRPLLPNPVVVESLLDRLIETSHQAIMNGPSYRPTKRPRNPTDKAK